ncbi:glycosyltransferase 87 family protein [Actinoplanes friuliensis]|uniref:Gpi18-like mannosyltransferase n=1 Tax=Actinoplanes friuliensis DSM 7358 TaxID=1246995 RepID=U5W8F0_9ACTN|nr:glycosyltransferase 87 family protein [Actinoplanes friuliensis]AGZ45419.1 hypothetical protein AFR_35815 [Actinoplanes friuliensis DSM 7358]
MRRARTELLLLGALALLAVVVRWVSRDEITADMRIFLQWYRWLDEAGGFPGLDREIGNYNAPFLYLLATLTYLPGPAILKIKAAWTVFDVLLVYFGYRIVALRYTGWRVPALAASVLAFLPTVVVNSSFWGQCDAMWASFCLGGLYFLLRGRQWHAVALLTVAIAVKPQAVFIFPTLVLLLLAGRQRWRTLLAAPAIYITLDLPAMLLGRDPIELLTLYSPARQTLHVPDLTSKAPTLYAFLPVTTRLDTLRTLGYVFAAVLVLGVIYTLIASRAKLDADRLVTAAALFSILVPFVLPGMHDRYFFLADALTVILTFYRPRLWLVPLLVQVGSLLSYPRFLFQGAEHGSFVPLPVLAALMLTALLITAHALVQDLRPGLSHATGLNQAAEPLVRRRGAADHDPGSSAWERRSSMKREAAGDPIRDRRDREYADQRPPRPNRRTTMPRPLSADKAQLQASRAIRSARRPRLP